MLENRLVSAVALEDDLESLENQLEIFADFAIAANVVVVQAHLAFEVDVAAAAYLPNAG